MPQPLSPLRLRITLKVRVCKGFNDPVRLHHYFVADLESRVLLNAARAGYSFFDDLGQLPSRLT